MMSLAQKRANAKHRQTAARKGLIRLELKAAAQDRDLLIGITRALREEPERAQALRRLLAAELAPAAEQTAAALFSSELDDDAFDGVFDAPRESGWRGAGI